MPSFIEVRVLSKEISCRTKLVLTDEMTQKHNVYAVIVDGGIKSFSASKLIQYCQTIPYLLG